MNARLVITPILCLCCSPLAHAESLALPNCTCNNDCKNVWPYTGICTQIAGGLHCYYTGPGIPCPELGMPKPDVGGPKVCKCNADCIGAPAPYCNTNPADWGPPVCTWKAPGIPCKEMGVPKLDFWWTCQCNDDCNKAAPYCNPTDWGQMKCGSLQPGIPCTRPPGLEPRPPDDFPIRRDFRVPSPAADGDPDAAVSPRSGCSLGAAADSGAPNALPLAGLLGVALLLGLRLRE